MQFTRVRLAVIIGISFALGVIGTIGTSELGGSSKPGPRITITATAKPAAPWQNPIVESSDSTKDEKRYECAKSYEPLELSVGNHSGAYGLKFNLDAQTDTSGDQASVTLDLTVPTNVSVPAAIVHAGGGNVDGRSGDRQFLIRAAPGDKVHSVLGSMSYVDRATPNGNNRISSVELCLDLNRRV